MFYRVAYRCLSIQVSLSSGWETLAQTKPVPFTHEHALTRTCPVWCKMNYVNQRGVAICEGLLCEQHFA